MVETGWKRRLAAAMAVAGLVAAGCSGDDTDASAATPSPTAVATDAPEATATPEPTPTPQPTVEEEPVTGFSERSVTFANIEFTILGATVTNQDLRSYIDGTEPVVDEGSRRLVLDVLAQNPTRTQIGLGDDEFGLEVGGQRLPLEAGYLSEITGFLRPGTAVESVLSFALDADTDVSGAALVIGATPDRLATLPLLGDIPVDSYPLELDLAGVARGTGPTNGGTLQFTLVDGSVFDDLPHNEVTSPSGQRADQGELFLQLHLQVEKIEGRGNDSLVDAFRLLVDGLARAPFDVAVDATGSTSSPTAEPGAVVDAWVLFDLPVDYETLALQVGAFDDDPGVIDLTLPALPDA